MTSISHRVDYDRIAHLYDEPGRDYDADPDLLQFMNEKAAGERPCLRALDLGCGTGKQLAADHARLPLLGLVGLDRFHGMLQQARRRGPGLDWVQGDGACLPFAAATFDYITNQYSYHHVPDKLGLFSEIHRVLKPGGRLAITNLDPWSMRGWIVYRYFPASQLRDFTDFLPEAELLSLLARCGFAPVRVRRQLSRGEQALDEFLAYAARRHRTSQLIAIEDQDYEDGLAAIRQSVQQADREACIPTELCRIWFIADKPA